MTAQEPRTAEYNTLCFVMEKLGQDVEKIQAALDSSRVITHPKRPPANDGTD